MFFNVSDHQRNAHIKKTFIVSNWNCQLFLPIKNWRMLLLTCFGWIVSQLWRNYDAITAQLWCNCRWSLTQLWGRCFPRTLSRMNWISVPQPNQFSARQRGSGFQFRLSPVSHNSWARLSLIWFFWVNWGNWNILVFFCAPQAYLNWSLASFSTIYQYKLVQSTVVPCNVKDDWDNFSKLISPIVGIWSSSAT